MPATGSPWPSAGRTPGPTAGASRCPGPATTGTTSSPACRRRIRRRPASSGVLLPVVRAARRRWGTPGRCTWAARATAWAGSGSWTCSSTGRGRWGSRVEFGREVTDLAQVAAEHDLVVLADGAGSRLRRSRVGRFGTVEQPGRNVHVWLKCPMALGDFTYAFEQTPAGWIWFYGYPYAPDASTVIVECAPGDVGRARLRRPGRRRDDGHPVAPVRPAPGRPPAAEPAGRGRPQPLGALPDDHQRALARRQRGAAGRLRAHVALLHRLGHEAGAAGRRRPRPGRRGARRTSCRPPCRRTRTAACRWCAPCSATPSGAPAGSSTSTPRPARPGGLRLLAADAEGGAGPRRPGVPGSPLDYGLHRATQWRVGRVRGDPAATHGAATRRR